MASSAPKLDPFSKQVRDTTDKMVAEGHPEHIVGDVHGLIKAVTKHFNLVPDSIVKSLPSYLHHVWYKCIQAGKNIKAWSESQDVLVCHLVAVRNLGSPPLQLAAPRAMHYLMAVYSGLIYPYLHKI
ncbi:unnamed protein product [Clonostachys solani]|uniref:Uncharacterized protein n=1 Tax=Clonostachys solani TaxID=160281 RepID=A0A9N9Z7J7_9HYPO|nr:unnamed protein product [Clonostachys solani]